MNEDRYRAVGAAYGQCLKVAHVELNKLVLPDHPYPEFKELDIFIWPQIWGDATLGAGGYGAQTIITADTLVVGSAYARTFVVFIGYKHRYTVIDASEKFLEDFRNHKLEGLKRNDYER